MGAGQQTISRRRLRGIAPPGVVRHTTRRAGRGTRRGRGVLKQQRLIKPGLQRIVPRPAQRLIQREVAHLFQPGAKLQDKAAAGAFVALHRGGQQHAREARHQLRQYRRRDRRGLVDD